MSVRPRHPALVRPPLHRRVGRALGAASFALAVVLVLVLAGLRVADWRPLVVLTGSMRPTIAPGDVVLADAVAASAVRPGDVVTFAAPDGSGRTITHRVRAIEPDPRRAGRLVVRTRGDANPAGEQWTVPADGTVRLCRGVLPGAPALRGVVADAVLRGALLATLSLLALGLALREIWRRPAADARPVVRVARRPW